MEGKLTIILLLSLSIITIPVSVGDGDTQTSGATGFLLVETNPDKADIYMDEKKICTSGECYPLPVGSLDVLPSPLKG